MLSLGTTEESVAQPSLLPLPNRYIYICIDTIPPWVFKLNNPSPLSLFSYRRCSSNLWWPFLGLTPGCSCLPCTGEPSWWLSLPQGPIAAHGHLAVHQDPRVIFCKAIFQLLYTVWSLACPCWMRLFLSRCRTLHSPLLNFIGFLSAPFSHVLNFIHSYVVKELKILTLKQAQNKKVIQLFFLDF